MTGSSREKLYEELGLESLRPNDGVENSDLQIKSGNRSLQITSIKYMWRVARFGSICTI